MDLPVGCKTPVALGFFSTVYFVILITLGGLVLPTLLVAVITASTDEQEQIINKRNEMDEMCRQCVAKFPQYMTPARMDLFKEVFLNLDVVSQEALVTPRGF